MVKLLLEQYEHILALNALLLANTFDVPLPRSSDDTGFEDVETEFEAMEATTSSDEETAINPDLDQAAVLYEKLIQGSMSADQVCQSNVMTRISAALKRETESLESSRTAALWLQYMDMVDILRKYIRAERTGNWELHLQAVSEMLPY